MKVIEYLIILNYAIRICTSMKLYVACILHNSEIPSLLYIKSVRLTDNCGGYMFIITTTFFFYNNNIIPSNAARCFPPSLFIYLPILLCTRTRRPTMLVYLAG